MKIFLVIIAVVASITPFAIMYMTYSYNDDDSLIYKIRLAWMKHKCHYCINCVHCYNGKCTRSLHYKIKTNLVDGYSYKQWNADDYSKCEYVIGFKECKYTPRGWYIEAD